jgi:hypothetical protein
MGASSFDPHVVRASRVPWTAKRVAARFAAIGDRAGCYFVVSLRIQRIAAFRDAAGALARAAPALRRL